MFSKIRSKRALVRFGKALAAGAAASAIDYTAKKLPGIEQIVPQAAYVVPVVTAALLALEKKLRAAS